MSNAPRFLIFTLFVIVLMAGSLFAGQLQRGDFSGVTPYTFDDDVGAVSPHDFGAFTLENFFDMHSFWISFDAPVELPTPGGENLILTFDLPQVAVGMDVAANADVYFYGANDILLAMIPAANIASWPERNGFAGYTDDNGEMIYWVQIGTFDAFLDNVYLGGGTVATQTRSWYELKSLYR